jgi:hypothetical protein
MLKKVDGKWILSPKYELHSFWPYSTVVLDRTLEKAYSSGDDVDQLSKELLEMFRKAGFKDVSMDNKIAFGFKGPNGKLEYIGFKDWMMSIGTDIKTDEWNKNREQKAS